MNKLDTEIRVLAGVQRASTFCEAADFILSLQSPLIVETGCYRGADCDGMSTLILAKLAKETGGKLMSFDINQGHINSASALIATHGLSEHCEFIVGDSSQTLKSINGVVSFAYLDSFDYEESRPILSQCHQLIELAILIPKMAERSAFLFDDCDLPEGGKGGLSCAAILRAKYSERASGYQKLFVRK